MNYTFHPAAAEEHLESVAYYESKQPGLGATYLAAFEAAITQVIKNPHLYPVSYEPDIRKIKLKRFPYSLFYRERDDAIQVLAVAHQKRRPEYWLGRF